MKGVGTPPLNSLEREELEKLRKERDRLKQKYEKEETISPKKVRNVVDSEGTESEDED